MAYILSAQKELLICATPASADWDIHKWYQMIVVTSNSWILRLSFITLASHFFALLLTTSQSLSSERSSVLSENTFWK